VRGLEKKRNDALEEVQITLAKIIAELDEKIRSKFFQRFM
jgi:hypothetical protein